MRAIEIFQVKGPAEGLRIVERPDPEVNPYTGEPGVVIEVEAAGVASALESVKFNAGRRRS
jgi:NADPH:quinone reductase-like Zn-dependent oxidoreductase